MSMMSWTALFMPAVRLSVHRMIWWCRFPHGDKDHADLENNNLSNIGVVNYLNTMKEMGLNPKKQVKE